MTITAAEFQLEMGRGLRAALNWEPYDIQSEILEDVTRNQVFCAGRRAGKSQTGGNKLLPYAFSARMEKAWLESTGKRRQYWIVGPEYSDSEKEFRVIYNGLRRLGVDFDRPGTYNNPQTGDMHISLWDGAFMVDALSAKYPDTLVGEGLSGIVLSEAAKLKPTVLPKYLRPTLADFKGWLYAGSTPEGRNWFYRAWQWGQDPNRPDWRSWRAPAWANPFVYGDMRVHGAEADQAVGMLQSLARKNTIPEHLSPELLGLMSRAWPSVDLEGAWAGAVERTWNKIARGLGVDPEIMSLILDLSEELFNQEEAALFNEFVGRVFKDFDETVHVGDFTYDPSWRTYATLDYGFTNPFVWLLIQVDPFNTNVRVIDEYYETGRTTGEAADEIRSRGLAPQDIIEFFPDPAEPDRSVEIANRLHIRRTAAGTGGAIQDRLEWIRRKLKPAKDVAHLDPSHEEWVPQLQIARRCKNTIREFNVYRYPKTAEEAASKDQSAPENPLKKDDHTPEALGRFMIGHFGSPWKLTGPARQSSARVGRSIARRGR